jgi:hypothetical protein
MLCTLCEQIDFREAFCSKHPVEHHATYNDLALSASRGCDFCKVAHTAVIDTHSEQLSLPCHDVVEMQLEQDDFKQLFPLDERSRFVIDPQEIDLDDRFAPFGSGVFGVQYNRENKGMGMFWRRYIP